MRTKVATLRTKFPLSKYPHICIICIYLFKVTKEHRQNLAEGAKKKLNECKNNIKKIQNNHVKKVSEDELSDEVCNIVFFYF